MSTPQITSVFPDPNNPQIIKVQGNNLQTIKQIGFELKNNYILFINPTYLNIYSVSASIGVIDIYNTPFYLQNQPMFIIYNTNAVPAANTFRSGSGIETTYKVDYKNIVDPSARAFITSDNKNYYDWNAYYKLHQGLTGQDMAISHWNNAGIYDGNWIFPTYPYGHEIIDDSNKNIYDWKGYFRTNQELINNHIISYDQNSAINYWNSTGIYTGKTFPKY